MFDFARKLPMRAFAMQEIDEALQYADEGGQALHLHRIVFEKSPKCFRDAVTRGESIGHLFDRNLERLKKTARRLGVRVIVVEREGTPRQHIDLCGRPMAKALAECEDD